MPKASWNGVVIADSDDTVVVERNHYFPRDSVKSEYLKPSELTTHCPWKGDAGYYNIEIDGDVNEDAAWFYSDPMEAAKNIKDHIAFWNGVLVQ